MQNQVVIEYRWDESLRTGDEVNDAQHKELIRQLNLLMAAMTRGEGPTQVEPLLRFLDNYTVKHFSHEEQCMAEHHCPLAETNKTAHAVFLKKLAAFRQQLTADSSGGALLAIQLLRELSDWFMNHIRRVDAQMLTCLKATQ